MNKVTYLGELEQMLLWTVLGLDERAYGLAIRNSLEKRTGRSVSRGAVYITLDRLVRKGYLESWLGEKTELRAGRAKRYFRLTAQGKRVLRQSKQALVNLWSGLEGAVEDGS